MVLKELFCKKYRVILAFSLIFQKPFANLTVQKCKINDGGDQYLTMQMTILTILQTCLFYQNRCQSYNISHKSAQLLSETIKFKELSHI